MFADMRRGLLWVTGEAGGEARAGAARTLAVAAAAAGCSATRLAHASVVGSVGGGGPGLVGWVPLRGLGALVNSLCGAAAVGGGRDAGGPGLTGGVGCGGGLGLTMTGGAGCGGGGGGLTVSSISWAGDRSGTTGAGLNARWCPAASTPLPAAGCDGAGLVGPWAGSGSSGGGPGGGAGLVRRPEAARAPLRLARCSVVITPWGARSPMRACSSSENEARVPLTTGGEATAATATAAAALSAPALAAPVAAAAGPAALLGVVLGWY